MPQLQIREIMTHDLTTLPSDSTIFEACQSMRDADIGCIVISDDDGIYGVVTDRDIVVRCVAEGKDPQKTRLRDICSRELCALSPGDSLEKATKLMRDKALRRLVVVEGKKPVGIVSLGDLAQTMDRKSVLGAISAATPNH